MKDTARNDPARKGSRRPDVEGDAAAEKAADQAEAALDNVNDGHEKAPPSAGGEPSWPTGGNISRGPKRRTP